MGKLKMPAEPRVRVLYNSELKSKNFIIPGLIAVIMTIIASMLTSLTIAREWESGSMEQLLSTPVRPSELLLGKLLAYFVLGMADMVIALVVGVGVFGVRCAAASCCWWAPARSSCLARFVGVSFSPR